MKKKLKAILPFLMLASLVVFPSCSDDDDVVEIPEEIQKPEEPEEVADVPVFIDFAAYEEDTKLEQSIEGLDFWILPENYGSSTQTPSFRTPIPTEQNSKTTVIKTKNKGEGLSLAGNPHTFILDVSTIKSIKRVTIKMKANNTLAEATITKPDGSVFATERELNASWSNIITFVLNVNGEEVQSLYVSSHEGRLISVNIE